jgi:hypothetical protein
VFQRKFEDKKESDKAENVPESPFADKSKLENTDNNLL